MARNVTVISTDGHSQVTTFLPLLSLNIPSIYFKGYFNLFIVCLATPYCSGFIPALCSRIIPGCAQGINWGCQGLSPVRSGAMQINTRCTITLAHLEDILDNDVEK